MVEFITKDSGKRVEFASSMKRDTNEGKMRPDLLYLPLVNIINQCSEETEDYAKLVLEDAFCLTKGINERDRFITGYSIKSFYELFQKYVFVTYPISKPDIISRLAHLMARGAEKYEADNWKKANSLTELDRFTESFLRHLLQFLSGETDEDHLAAVLFNLGGMLYLIDEKQVITQYHKTQEKNGN